jgi:hypothetical protein
MAMSEKIKQEIAAFEKMRDELSAHHNGKHVVIKDGQLVGSFDTFDAAAREAVQRFGADPFLIRQVGSPDCVRMPASVAWRPLHAPS